MQRPWSAEEQERLDRLVGTDPGSLAASADRFDAVAAELADIGRAAGAVGVEATVGPSAAASCTALAAAIESEATEVTALAGELRAASARLDTWLTELVRQVLRVGDGVRDGGAYRSSLWLAQRDADEADTVTSLVARYPGRNALELAEPAALARWTRLDELVGAHGAVLAALRAGLAAADVWDAGPGSATGAGPAPWVGTGADSGSGSGPGPGPDRSGGAGAWLSEGPAPEPDVVVDREYRDRVSRDWQPLLPEPAIQQAPVVPVERPPEQPGAVPDRPAQVPVASSQIQPGTGPRLAGVEGDRVGTDMGVRVAELPDAPATRARQPAR
ncbi:MAG TPA: hypothetical protein VNP03_12015 [Pseudonocardia sp.]|nr:hypothetical protein [Pseudonocardia sp.]